jgi:small-conductance mechanosensitive channel
MIRDASPRRAAALATLVATVVAAVFAVAVPIPFHGPLDRALPARIALLVRLEVFFTTANLLLLLALGASYVGLYRDLPNKYTRSLLVLCAALLLYATTSNPVVHLLSGFRPRPNVGPFVFVPDLFVGLAIVVLLYQSRT